ncbi:MAG: hypothetical protein PW789_04550 [Edaphobacter sp.]|uniref:hypothetical protein n=1 Tax=Edaphobacter sp. TaxID=1934404 RepID=UPI002383F58E|nr:hypothetical protein [Edaphobacter sp.]MDE1175856.1 hypothetical protein [Edaphobacter sp.]
MVCQACGGPVTPEVRFCSLCGAQVIAVPPTAAPPQQYAAYPMYAPPMSYTPPVRVQRHLQTLGTLWCVLAVWRVIEGLLGMFFVKVFVFRHWHGDWPDRMGFMPPWMHLLPVIMGFAVAAALFTAFVGWSLLTRRSYGRVLAIVAAVLMLFKMPLGTAVGIYTLWVLLPAASALEYDAMAEPG